MLLKSMELTWSSSATKILELLDTARYPCYRKNCNPYKVKEAITRDSSRSERKRYVCESTQRSSKS